MTLILTSHSSSNQLTILTATLMHQNNNNTFNLKHTFHFSFIVKLKLSEHSLITYHIQHKKKMKLRSNKAKQWAACLCI